MQHGTFGPSCLRRKVHQYKCTNTRWRDRHNGRRAAKGDGMAQEQATGGVMSPQHLAHLRAALYGQRVVTNRDVAVLLEAYDDLALRLAEAMRSGATFERARAA